MDTRFEDEQGNVLAQDSFTRGLYVVGQSVTVKSQSYEVVSAIHPNERFDGMHVVVCRPADTCQVCGGIKGKRTPPYEDVCLWR